MKKILFLALILSLGIAFTACDNKKNGGTNETLAEEVNPEAEEAVKAYEAWADKQEELADKKEAGEDIFEALMALTDEGFEVSEKLLKLEGKMSADQQARIQACAQRIEKNKTRLSEL